MSNATKVFVRHEKSSQIHSMHHDPDNHLLTVRFKCRMCHDGNTSVDGCLGTQCGFCSGRGHASEYEYVNVPAEKYAQIRDAESVGSAFGKLIKNQKDKHPYRRIR